MFSITPEQAASLNHWFQPERPGPLIGPHALNSGHGQFLVNRWPEPQVVLAETAGNYSLLGEAAAITPAELAPHITGFVETSAAFVPLLQAAFPQLIAWPRVIYSQLEAVPFTLNRAATVHRLESADVAHLATLEADLAWISKTWDGPLGLAASQMAWGAFVDGQLASVACTFFLGDVYEDIGVVTESKFRGLGLNPACVHALCVDIRARRHTPSWSTSTDNAASQRVAEKLGFTLHRNDWLYVVGIELP